jgi:phosphate transport system substrate-binding protein
MGQQGRSGCRSGWLIVVIGVVLAACQSGPAAPAGGEHLSGTLTISGAWALYPLMVRWSEAFRAEHPDVQFDISAGGAGKGMADALAGIVDIGMVSREVAPEEVERGAFWVPVTRDAVFATVNAANPALPELLQRGITREQFSGIYITGAITTWGQLVGQPALSDPIHVYTRSDAAGAPETWARFLGHRQEDLRGLGVYGDPGIIEAVIKDRLAIGYSNLGYAFDLASGQPVAGAQVVPIDADANGRADADEALTTLAQARDAVARGVYPAPPARDLNLVTRGKPQGLTRAFLIWIVTRGQPLAEAAGYVALPEATLREALERLQ